MLNICSADKNLPKVPRRYFVCSVMFKIITLPTAVWLFNEPVCFERKKCWIIQQTIVGRRVIMMPFTNTKTWWFITPLFTSACNFWVVIRKTIIRSTWFRKDRLVFVCEVLNNLPSWAIGHCSDVKGSSWNLLVAEKSELFKRQFCSESMKPVRRKREFVLFIFLNFSKIVCQRPIRSFWLLKNQVSD